ncbi:MAG: hypothetical protein WA669_09590, partial [Pseudolabrys sp.]
MNGAPELCAVITPPYPPTTLAPDGRSRIYLDLVPFRSKSPATKRTWEAGMAQAAVKIFEQESGIPESAVLDRA